MKVESLLRIVRLGRLKLPMIAYLLFFFGALLAVISGAGFVLDRFILGSAIVLAALLSVNYANDYFDVDVDQYNKPTAISGGSGVLRENPELRRFAKWFSVFLIGLSVGLAAIFTVLFSFPPVFILFVASGNLIGWFYAAPPLKLSYRGLSEIATVIAVGLMIPSMGYLILKTSFDVALWIFALPCAFYALAFIISVEIPDFEGDRQGNKKTLVTLKGRRFGFAVIALSFSLATLYFMMISTINLVSLIDFRVITLFSLVPSSFGIVCLVEGPEKRDLATKLVSCNVGLISVLLLMIDLYFIVLLKFWS